MGSSRWNQSVYIGDEPMHVFTSGYLHITPQEEARIKASVSVMFASSTPAAIDPKAAAELRRRNIQGPKRSRW